MRPQREGPPSDEQALDGPAYAGTSPFRAAKREPLVRRVLPVAGDLATYRPDKARRDLSAGLTVAALALPAAMAYAELAGLQPTAGLYALLLPTVAYALLGSSRQLIVGPEGALPRWSPPRSSRSGGRLPQAGELAAMLALLVAAASCSPAPLGLGWLADYLSRPVLIGYIHGVAIVLIVAQLAEAARPQHRGDEADTASSSRSCARSGTRAAPRRRRTGARWRPDAARCLAPRLPASLIVVVGAIVASEALDLAAHGVAVVGAIPSGLPEPRRPRPSRRATLSTSCPPPSGIFVVVFADEILTARSFAGRTASTCAPAQELLAMGAGNAAAGIHPGRSRSARSGSRTAVNDPMGGRTQFAGADGGRAVVARAAVPHRADRSICPRPCSAR